MMRYLFNPKRPKKRRHERDEVDSLIDKIERFAPRRYQPDRQTYYYNYRMMEAYRGPLIALLQTLSRQERLQMDPHGLTQEVFWKLKAFYDPKEKLSKEEAGQD